MINENKNRKIRFFVLDIIGYINGFLSIVKNRRCYQQNIHFIKTYLDDK
jgi:hypothetical protein